MSAIARHFLCAAALFALAACDGTAKDTTKKSPVSDNTLSLPVGKPVSDAQAKEFAQIFLAKTPWGTARLIWTAETDGAAAAQIAAATRVQTDRACTISALPMETDNGVFTAAISGAACALKADYSLTVQTTKPTGSTPSNHRYGVEKRWIRSASTTDAADGLLVAGVVLAETLTGWSGRDQDIPYGEMNGTGRISLIMKDGSTLDIRTVIKHIVNGATKSETKQVDHYAVYKGTEFILTTYVRSWEGRLQESRTFINNKDLNEILAATSVEEL